MLLLTQLAAKNVLVFNGGRTVKLADFGSAVRVGDSKAMHKGWTPYFAAPEIVRGDVPYFPADIWSTLCVLIEMLTAKKPGCCQHNSVTDVAMMFLVRMERRGKEGKRERERERERERQEI